MKNEIMEKKIIEKIWDRNMLQITEYIELGENECIGFGIEIYAWNRDNTFIGYAILNIHQIHGEIGLLHERIVSIRDRISGGKII